MSDEFVFILARFVERVLAVAIGGLLVYFGYRLFLAIPNQSAEGQAELSFAKDKRLLLTRIGPGTFFALFGTAVLITSYAFPVKWSPEAGFSGFGKTAAPARLIAPGKELPPRPLAPDEIQVLTAFLTDVEAAYAKAKPDAYDPHTSRRFRDAKLAIMTHSWQAGWGDPVEFETWVNETPPRSARPEFERALTILEGGK